MLTQCIELGECRYHDIDRSAQRWLIFSLFSFFLSSSPKKIPHRWIVSSHVPVYARAEGERALRPVGFERASDLRSQDRLGQAGGQW